MRYSGYAQSVNLVLGKPLTEWASHAKWVCRRHVPTLYLPAIAERCWIKNCPSVAPPAEERPPEPVKVEAPPVVQAPVKPRGPSEIEGIGIITLESLKKTKAALPAQATLAVPPKAKEMKAPPAKVAVEAEPEKVAVKVVPSKEAKTKAPAKVPVPKEVKPKAVAVPKAAKPKTVATPKVAETPAIVVDGLTPSVEDRRRGATAVTTCSNCGAVLWRRPKEVRESKTGKFFCTGSNACKTPKSGK